MPEVRRHLTAPDVPFSDAATPAANQTLAGTKPSPLSDYSAFPSNCTWDRPAQKHRFLTNPLESQHHPSEQLREGQGEAEAPRCVVGCRSRGFDYDQAGVNAERQARTCRCGLAHGLERVLPRVSGLPRLAMREGRPRHERGHLGDPLGEAQVVKPALQARQLRVSQGLSGW